MKADLHSTFLTTRWTCVLASRGESPEARVALTSLCEAYYGPLHAYIARSACDLGDPRDLTQEFFSRIVEGTVLGGADPERGRFRGYLLGAVKHFLANVRDRRGAAKRGADREHVSLASTVETSPGLEVAAPNQPPPDAWFDRQWGLALLERALGELGAEHEREGKGKFFTVLKPWLAGRAGELDPSEAAARIGLTPGACKVAVHRLRKRFRELVKAEIAQTVEGEEAQREELRYLIEVVA
jgi:RNA polymerase sigma-70 factor (ECF subfamily)